MALRVRISVGIDAVPDNTDCYMSGSLYLGGMIDERVGTLADAVELVEKIRSVIGEDTVHSPDRQA